MILVGIVGFLIIVPIGFSAWWNESWTYQRNITITEIADYPIADYPIAYLVPKANFSHTNCSDGRILNQSQDELPLSIMSRNATDCAIVHNVTLGNLTSIDYELYYGNTGESESDLWVNWSAMRRRQDSFEDADYVNEPTWTVGANTGNIDTGIGCGGIGIGNALEECALNFTSTADSGGARDRLQRDIVILDGKAFGYWVKWSNPELTHNYNGRINLATATETRCQISITNANALDCDVDGSGFGQVWYPINADEWYRLVFEFNYGANTVNITLYAENRTWLNSSLFTNEDEAITQILISMASSQAGEIFSVDLATHVAIVEPEPIIALGALNFTPPTTTTTLPPLAEIDYCQLLWFSQGAQVRKNDDWCADNTTLARNITFVINIDGENESTIVSYSEQDCRYGCDNVTAKCAPSPFGLDVWIFILAIAIIILIWLVGKATRRW